MQENKSKRWSVGLKFVQWQINISRHETISHSPFKVTFGQEPQVGLGSSVLPSDILCEISTEEELEAFLDAAEETSTAAEEDTRADTGVIEVVSETAEVDEETTTAAETRAETRAVTESLSTTAEVEEETTINAVNDQSAKIRSREIRFLLYTGTIINVLLMREN